jgi:PAS domain S-box-containing protein
MRRLIAVVGVVCLPLCLAGGTTLTETDERHQAPAGWVRDHAYFLAGGFIVMLQGLLIGALLVQRARRRRAEQELQQSEEVHRLTLASISDAVFITTSGGEFKFVCPNVHVIFGYSREEAEGLGNIRHLLGDGLPAAAANAATDISNLECTVRDKEGRERYLLVGVKRIAIAGGSMLYTCRDVTDRRLADEAFRRLRHVNRLAGMGELTAMIAHEVNQPLGAILSNTETAEILLDRPDPPLHEIRQILSDIRSDDLGADESIRRIRGLLRRREIQHERVRLNDTVGDVLKLGLTYSHPDPELAARRMVRCMACRKPRSTCPRSSSARSRGQRTRAAAVKPS